MSTGPIIKGTESPLAEHNIDLDQWFPKWWVVTPPPEALGYAPLRGICWLLGWGKEHDPQDSPWQEGLISD